jgi:gliding motility-associated-like protein
MRSISLAFSIFLFITSFLTAQPKLQIPLDPGRISPLNDAIQTANGDYLMCSGVIPSNPFAGANINLTRFTPGDGVLWSRDLELEKGINRAKILEWPSEDALLVAAVVLDSAQNKVLIKCTPDGQVIWARRYGDDFDIFPANLGRADVWPEDDGTAILAGGPSVQANSTDPNDLFIGRIDANGQLIWANKICFSCNNGDDAVFADLLKTQDGNYVLAGSIEPVGVGFPNLNVLLIKFDVDGNLLWSKYYTPDAQSFVRPDAFAIHLTERPNGNLVVAGYLEDVGTFQRGLVLETMPDGALAEVQSIELINSDHEIQVNNAIPLGNEQLAISMGTRQDTLASVAVELNIIAQIGLDNFISWQHNYLTEPSVGYLTPTDVFFPQRGGGFAYFPSFAQGFDSFFSYFILTDEQGSNGCEGPVSISVREETGFAVTDISPTLEALTQEAGFGVNTVDFNGYVIDLPVVDLGPDTTSCDTIPIVLDASINGNYQYLWNTGDTTATLSADTTGLYAVSVTNTDSCLQLVDSIRVSFVAGLPELTLSLDTTGFCTDSMLTLIANVSNADSVVWSTGETADTIKVADAGSYTAEAFNFCGSNLSSIEVELPRCKTICPFFFPNVFTPNSDGTNDLFRPVGECPEISDYQLEVYNRWGDKVYDSTLPSDGWDGQVNGEPAPSDVYIWVAMYTIPDQEGMIKEQGDVTLLR